MMPHQASSKLASQQTSQSESKPARQTARDLLVTIVEAGLVRCRRLLSLLARCCLLRLLAVLYLLCFRLLWFVRCLLTVLAELAVLAVLAVLACCALLPVLTVLAVLACCAVICFLCFLYSRCLLSKVSIIIKYDRKQKFWTKKPF